MKTLTVALPGREYEIAIQRGLLSQAGERIRAVLPRARRLAVVTDTNVGPLYYNKVKAGLERAGFEPGLFSPPAGEKSKNAAQLSQLWEGFMDFGLTRTDGVVALGGGVVGDLAGFAAATVLRGVDYVQIPTTLLAQVDSSVGGKVAIDLAAGKNLAGAFWQPKLVLMDPETLNTLSDAVFSDGMGEVIKYGCIANKGLFNFLLAHPSRREVMEHIEYILTLCCDLKREVVVEDERDTGRRMLLNFGHTLGHAIEKNSGFTVPHGHAVAMGMVLAARAAERMAYSPAGTLDAVLAACRRFRLPTQCPYTAPQLYAAAISDKKRDGGSIDVVVLEELGRARTVRLDLEGLRRFTEAAL